MGDVTVHIG